MMPPVRLSDLAALGGFQVIRDGAIATLGFLGVSGGQFLGFLEHKRHLRALRQQPGLAGIIATDALAAEVPETIALAVSLAPRSAFFTLHNRLAEDTEFYRKRSTSEISPGAKVHPRAFVDPQGVCIGPGCVVAPNATVLAGTEMRAGAVVQSGAVIGGTGFQRTLMHGEAVDLVHAGNVVLDEGSVVMSNAVVARAVFHNDTHVGAGSRVGNGAFVSHGTRVGANCLIGHGAVVAGNCQVGDGVTIGPGAIIADRISLGQGARVSLGAVVIRDVPAGKTVSGSFAASHSRALRTLFSHPE
jgi:UDP-3-O-[3-hydroxymyristoyl] glucosamine N-acyltransferase